MARQPLGLPSGAGQLGIDGEAVAVLHRHGGRCERAGSPDPRLAEGPGIVVGGRGVRFVRALLAPPDRHRRTSCPREPRHRVALLRNLLVSIQMTAAEVLPRVHLIFSLLKRCILGTHEGSVPQTSRRLPREVYLPASTA